MQEATEGFPLIEADKDQVKQLEEVRRRHSEQPDSQLIRVCQQASIDDTLIVCVGAGVSRQVASLPSWQAMIEDLISTAIQRNDSRAFESFRNVVVQDEYLAIPGLAFVEDYGLRCKLINYILDIYKARFGDVDGPSASARQALSPEEFSQWLWKTFSMKARNMPTKEIYENDLMVALRAWQRLRSRFMTTNYDDVLEIGLAASKMSISTALTQLSHQSDVARAWIPAGSHIYHLHGYYDDPPSIIFAPSEYDSIAQDDLLRDILQNNTVIFIGCGGTLTDRHFLRLLDEARHGIARHFSLILSRDRSDSIPTSVKQIVYGTSYDELAPYLAKIARRLEEQQRIANIFGKQGPVMKHISQ